MPSIPTSKHISPVLDDIRSINLGSVYENVVAQELRAHGHKLYYYDNRKQGATWDNSVVSNSITGNALFFPASGFRSNSGSLNSVGGYGYYWSASPYSGDGGHSLASIASAWQWNYYGRAGGFPVRAVAEE